MPIPAAETIFEALSHGVAGDRQAGLALLQPLVDDGPSSTYAVLGALAQVVVRRPLSETPPGVFCRPVQVDDMAPSMRFATRFIAAWANGDPDMTCALFWSVAEFAETHRTGDLAGAICALYNLAVDAAKDAVLEQRLQGPGEPR